MAAESSPKTQHGKNIDMLPTYRVFNFGLAVLAAACLFALSTVTPLAQSGQLPSPTSHISDLAGVIDPKIKTQLEGLLANLKEKTKVELYVVMVDSTDGQPIDEFSQRLANEWNIAGRNTRTRSLLMVVSAASKSSFTKFSRPVQSQLPDGVLGEMSYRMRGPLSDGRFTEAIDGGVRVFVNALAEKVGFNAADLEPASTVAANTSTTETPQPILASTRDVEKTRPRVVSDAARVQDPQPTPTPPSDVPKTEPTPESKAEPTPAETSSPEASPAESPKVDPTPSESPKNDTTITELPEAPKKSTETEKPPRRNLNAKGTTTVKSTTKKTAATTPVQVEDDEETVSLTLVLPVAERVVKLKEWLDAHPDSKERGRAIEYLVSAYAALGDQKLKNGDSPGGIEHLQLAIDAADPATTPDNLFTGVIAQIPTNLYLRGERTAAFKAAQSIETKFASEPKRLLALANFYLGIERGDEAVRIADSAIKLAPDLAEAHRIKAVGLHLSLRLDEAADEYKRTLELDSSSKVTRVSLADLYRASGKAEQALALYNEELAANPKDRAARAGKVISLLELSRVDEANTELTAALTEEPRNLPLLAGAAYWFAAHGDNNKAFDLARRAVAVESRYTWAQIALAHTYLSSKQPLDAERAMRYARQYGKFPTLNYELANVLASMGLYQEAFDVLHESFDIKEGQIHTRLAGHLPANDANFIDLLAPERRGGIFQPRSADTPENAKLMKALLAFNVALTPADGAKADEATAVAAAQEFASGTDNMRAFRQLYAANRLLRNGVAMPTVLELVAAARKASDEALSVPMVTMAVQADEFRDLRARAIASGRIPDVADAPRNVLTNILKGRMEDLEGWALFNQEKYTAAIDHLKQAEKILPANTPAWRAALWHLGAAHVQTGQNAQALDYYIKSYQGAEPDSVKRSIIEQLYRKVNGSTEGLENRLNGTVAETPTTAPETPKAEPEPAKTEPEPVSQPATTEPAKEVSEEQLRNAASRLRTNIKITGRILGPDQAPLANATVVLISPSGSVIAATTDSEGNYSFTVAPSQKTYRVIPSKDGYSFAPLDRTFGALIDDQRNVDFVASKQ
ncbi:MAG TPA: TPM domain-containing protein [Pyrinomonadaceae bacterium]|nr:TPM domain-containing protein [Pyrinomonadaceae bacterium]